MVTDTYAHIIDKNHKKTAQKFEEAFYGKNEQESPDKSLELLIERPRSNGQTEKIACLESSKID